MVSQEGYPGANGPWHPSDGPSMDEAAMTHLDGNASIEEKLDSFTQMIAEAPTDVREAWVNRVTSSAMRILPGTYGVKANGEGGAPWMRDHTQSVINQAMLIEPLSAIPETEGDVS